MATRRKQEELAAQHDQMMQTQDENLRLKRERTQQEEQLKRLNTKLLRLQEDVKRSDLNRSPSRSGQANGGGAVRSGEVEDLREELHRSNLRAEKMQQRMQVMTVQMSEMQNGPKLGNSRRFANTSSRIDTGRRPKTSNTKKLVPFVTSSRLSGSSTFGTGLAPAPPRQPKGNASQIVTNLFLSQTDNFEVETDDPGTLHEVVQLLVKKTLDLDTELHKLREEARGANDRRDAAERAHRSEVDAKDAEAARLRDSVSKLERDTEELRRTHVPTTQLDEKNQEIASGQEQLRSKLAEVDSLEQRVAALESTLAALKKNHTGLLDHSKALNAALKDEKARSAVLRQDLAAASVSSESASEAQRLIDELREEKRELERTNNDLLRLHKADAPPTHDLDSLHERSRVAEADLERAKGDHDTQLAEKDRAIEELRSARDEALRRCTAMEERASVFAAGDGVEVDELREALDAIRSGRLKQANDTESALAQTQQLSSDVSKLRLENMELAAENEKMNKMLQLQEEINRDYKQIADDAAMEGSRVRSEYEHKLNDEARLLDIKTDRIVQLEEQLQRQIFKGADDNAMETEGVAGLDDDADAALEQSLSPDENIFELTILTAHLDPKALRRLAQHNDRSFDISEDGDLSECMSFVAVDWYDFETVCSPTSTGSQPHYGLTTRFRVKRSDRLLHFLRFYLASFEFCVARGVDYDVVAASRVSFRQLLEKGAVKQGGGGTNRLFGTAELVSVQDQLTSLGTIQWSVRFWHSMAEEIRLWKARTAATALAMEMQQRREAEAAGLQMTTTGNFGATAFAAKDPVLLGLPKNELMVKVIGCRKLLHSAGTGLQATRGESTMSAVATTVPEAFVGYQFYAFPEHIGPSQRSHDPVFDDLQSFPIIVSTDLEEYLLTQTLDFLVFDDNAVASGDAYFGAASVPLAPLAHNKKVQGTFHIISHSGEPTGSTIELEVYWTRPFQRPPAVHQTMRNTAGRSLLATTAAANTVGRNDTRASEATLLGMGGGGSDDDGQNDSGLIQSMRQSRRDPFDSDGAAGSQDDDDEWVSEDEYGTSDTDPLTSTSLKRPVSRDAETQTRTRRKKATGDGQKSRSSKPKSSRASSRSASPRGRSPPRRERVDREESSSPPHGGPEAPLALLSQTRVREGNLDPSEYLAVTIHALELDGHALLHHQANLQDVFVSFEFLRYPPADLETIPIAVDTDYLQQHRALHEARDGGKHSHALMGADGSHLEDCEPQHFNWDFTRIFPIEPNRFKLYTLLHSTSKADADLIFDIMNHAIVVDSHGHRNVQCPQLGTAEINLRNLLKHGTDLVEEDLPVKDQYDNNIGHLWVSVTAVAALNAVARGQDDY